MKREAGLLCQAVAMGCLVLFVLAGQQYLLPFPDPAPPPPQACFTGMVLGSGFTGVFAYLSALLGYGTEE